MMIKCILALLACFSFVSANENIASETSLVQEEEGALLAKSQAVLDGLIWEEKDQEEAGNKREPPCGCNCPKGYLLIGKLIPGVGQEPARQSWNCVKVTPNCRVKCRTYDGFCGFCRSDEILERPTCKVPLDIFSALPRPVPAKSAEEEQYDGSANTEYFLTFGKDGFSIIAKQEPIVSCRGECRECERPVCLQRFDFDN